MPSELRDNLGSTRVPYCSSSDDLRSSLPPGSRQSYKAPSRATSFASFVSAGITAGDNTIINTVRQKNARPSTYLLFLKKRHPPLYI